MLHPLLQEKSPSLNHEKLAEILIHHENILIIQDLDGVCMGLVKDPLNRTIDPNYVRATKAFAGHFYVLTNGEHIGKRGVNPIIDRAFGDANFVKENALYLPGFGAGGVQWQDRAGKVSHPGVTDQELAFLSQVPQRIQQQLEQFFQAQLTPLSPTEIKEGIEASILDNIASPTANLNTLYDKLKTKPEVYAALQATMQKLMETLLKEAAAAGLKDSFFVHYAPNLGRDQQGKEIMRPVAENDSGTTDFQFMIRGAIKEAGVLAILNRYYYQRTGNYPLGETFNVRNAPNYYSDLYQLVTNHFDPELMPIMIGVGDTVNSSVTENNGQLEAKRGGSDRAFLQLIQEIHPHNIVVYIDSSDGEVKNRKPVRIENTPTGEKRVTELPTDPRDTTDPLTLNVIFPEGHSEYTAFFRKVAAQTI
ncbi:glucosylglycerol 3-phosphatase [Halothece sp. PCC 7418]|uniref:glucosylglycerol 3-phosphatase n=1 Tax=Halothece sp. (strain PCC 7418) TaxID=65093 RepID=UPI0003182F62|nr:glucosylglycerol 3-phosphatase [Halothece sp. PCC 7418]